MKEKKDVKLIKCRDCGEEVYPNTIGNHIKKHGYKNKKEYNIYHKLEPSDEELLADGAISCKICGLISHELTSHITRTHKISVNEYKEKYNTSVISEKHLLEMSKRITGEKNPAYNHGGKLSPFSKKYIYADETNIDKLLEKANNTRKENNNETTKIEYWLKKTNGNLEEAKKLLSDRQSTFSLAKCIEKHGEEIGKEKWLTRQEKWISTLNSKSDEEKERINRLKIGNGYSISSAERELLKIISEKFDDVEHQFSLADSKNNKQFVYDIRYKNKIVEYHGDWWHCNPNKYNSEYYHPRVKKCAKDIWKRDEIKMQFAIDNGYQVYVIWEHNYTTDKINRIDKCIKFLIV